MSRTLTAIKDLSRTGPSYALQHEAEALERGIQVAESYKDRLDSVRAEAAVEKQNHKLPDLGPLDGFIHPKSRRLELEIDRLATEFNKQAKSVDHGFRKLVTATELDVKKMDAFLGEVESMTLATKEILRFLRKSVLTDTREAPTVMDEVKRILANPHSSEFDLSPQAIDVIERHPLLTDQMFPLKSASDHLDGYRALAFTPPVDKSAEIAELEARFKEEHGGGPVSYERFDQVSNAIGSASAKVRSTEYRFDTSSSRYDEREASLANEVARTQLSRLVGLKQDLVDANYSYHLSWDNHLRELKWRSLESQTERQRAGRDGLEKLLKDDDGWLSKLQESLFASPYAECLDQNRPDGSYSKGPARARQALADLKAAPVPSVDLGWTSSA